LRRALASVRRAVRGRQLWQRGDHLLLGCSGGLDSLVALALLHRLQPSLGHGLAVGHVNHALWPGADAAQELVQRAAAALGVPFASRRLVLAHGADLEARARDQRYAALQSMASELGCTLLATAHHADDQAETLLLRLGRGAVLDALAGIRARRQDGVVRPLLHLDRQTLQAVAHELALVWHDDPSNADLSFTRNRIRHRVLPELQAAIPGAASGLARTAEHLAEHGTVLDAWIARALADHLRIKDASAELDHARVPTQRAMQASLLRHICARLAAPMPSERALDQACAVLAAGRGEAKWHGMTMLGDLTTWRFLVRRVAERPGAD